MTERLYYTDPDLVRFDGTVLEASLKDNLYFTILDRSAFYPTSGGQLHDTGSINDIPVVNVEEDDAGRVVHYSNQEIASPGDSVSGVVDVKRRWRHRQQHTAQHILSQLCIRLFNMETVSVHLGEEYGAIELSGKELTEAQRCDLEARAAELLRDSLPVDILMVDAEEAARLPLRKVPPRTDQIRVIRIGELDWSACGGTHCRLSSQVGVIKVIGTERLRGHVVVKFLAGIQALSDYQDRFDVSEQLARQMTCHYQDIPAKLEKLTAEMKSTNRRLSETEKELTPIRAARLAETVTEVSGVPVVCEPIDGVSGDGLIALASAVATQISGLSLLLGEDRLILSAAPGTCHAGKLARSLCSKTGLRGGGGETVAQFGGAERSRFLEYSAALRGILENEASA